MMIFVTVMIQSFIVIHIINAIIALISLVDFTQQQKQGCLCLYSIKNPAYPEYSVITDSPIICLDVFKETPYLVCVGKFQYLIIF